MNPIIDTTGRETASAALEIVTKPRLSLKLKSYGKRAAIALVAAAGLALVVSKVTESQDTDTEEQ